MRKIFSCRRSSIALIGMILLTALGIINGIDVSLAITGIVASIAGANSYENATMIKSSKISAGGQE
jgi:hypothetical protein